MSDAGKNKGRRIRLLVGLIVTSALAGGLWQFTPALSFLEAFFEFPPEDKPQVSTVPIKLPVPKQKYGATLFFGASDGSGLVERPVEVILREDTTRQAMEVLRELIREPQDEFSGELSCLAGIQFHSVFLDRHGTAYVNVEGWSLSAGTSTFLDLCRAYSVTNTLAFSFPGTILRVQLLPRKEPLNQVDEHLDLTEPLIPRRDLVVGTAKF